MKLHVHSVDHDQAPHHDHLPAENAIGHSHLSEAHLSIDVSHVDHHDEVVSEVDASPDGLLKKISSNIVILALLAAGLVLFLPELRRHTFSRRRDEDIRIPWRYHLSPPLRAPPS